MLATKQSQSENTTKAKNNAPFFPGHLVQPKLQVNEPGDRYEQEADAMADQVMRMSNNSRKLPPGIWRKPSSLGNYRKSPDCNSGKHEAMQQLLDYPDPYACLARLF
ncbi:hypothetical protein [Mucilaginibacter sp. NFX135]|uniref:hypothetical protein n=1 Tax=Mucilaginibacter sp. NFX135 TaxID=3402687 RepID=UPI003AFB6077